MASTVVTLLHFSALGDVHDHFYNIMKIIGLHATLQHLLFILSIIRYWGINTLMLDNKVNRKIHINVP